jgi:regulator of sigma E protease
MIFLAIEWAGVGVQVAQLLLALSLLIVLHEFGHYITARWFGCRVEKFFLFFDPWFALFKKKVGDTTYGIGWLPLGGYVKISGMIDESMDKEQMNLPPQPHEFRSKPAWQRLIIMLGGIIMNVLVAFIIYALVLFKWGEKKIPMSSLKNGIAITDCLMYDVGFRNGDKVISVNGKPLEYYNDLHAEVLLGKWALVERNGKLDTVRFREDLLGVLSAKKTKRRTLFDFRIPAVIGSYEEVKEKDPRYPSYKAGLRENDKVIAVNSTPVQFYDEIRTNILRNIKLDSARFTVLRGADTLNIVLPLNEEKRAGVPMMTADTMMARNIFRQDTTHYGFFASFPAGVRKTGERLNFYVRQFKKILDPDTEAYKGVGGFRAMGRIFPGEWDWESFWNITAFLSIILAFMNLLPIPALDGGHVMFTLYEMIARRKPNQKFLEYAQMGGMIILLGLMLYANGNDWFGWGAGGGKPDPLSDLCELSKGAGT